MEWFIKFPMDAYAMGPIEASSAAAVRRWARTFFGYARLPVGVQVWPK